MKDQWDCAQNDLKSSEVKNFLFWWINTMLNLFQVSSSFLYVFFFHFSSDQRGQYGKRFWRLSLMLHNSIALSLSRNSLPWQKMNQFLQHFIIGDWMFSWFNIGPKSFSKRKSSCGWTGRNSSLWFCSGLWSACKITRIQFERIFFELHFWGFLLVVVQIRDQLVEAMRNSYPRAPKFTFKQQIATSNTGPFWVFPLDPS